MFDSTRVQRFTCAVRGLCRGLLLWTQPESSDMRTFQVVFIHIERRHIKVRITSAEKHNTDLYFASDLIFCNTGELRGRIFAGGMATSHIVLNERLSCPQWSGKHASTSFSPRAHNMKQSAGVGAR